MLRPFDDDVVPLAESLEVLLVIMTQIIMRCAVASKPRRWRVAWFGGRGRLPPNGPATVIPPHSGVFVPPAAVADPLRNHPPSASPAGRFWPAPGGGHKVRQPRRRSPVSHSGQFGSSCRYDSGGRCCVYEACSTNHVAFNSAHIG